MQEEEPSSRITRIGKKIKIDQGRSQEWQVNISIVIKKAILEEIVQINKSGNQTNPMMKPMRELW